jgi:DNA-binding MarR family transcriptional regulator
VSTEQPARITGLLRTAADRAFDAVRDEVLARHADLRAAHVQVFSGGPIDGLRVTELADRAAMTKQSMHELVGHLERCGYVRREPDPADQRARLVRLTDRGRTLQETAHAASARLHLQWRDRVGDARFDALWAALQELAGLPGSPPERLDALRGRAATVAASRSADGAGARPETQSDIQ